MLRGCLIPCNLRTVYVIRLYHRASLLYADSMVYPVLAGPGMQETVSAGGGPTCGSSHTTEDIEPT